MVFGFGMIVLLWIGLGCVDFVVGIVLVLNGLGCGECWRFDGFVAWLMLGVLLWWHVGFGLRVCVLVDLLICL